MQIRIFHLRRGVAYLLEAFLDIGASEAKAFVDRESHFAFAGVLWLFAFLAACGLRGMRVRFSHLVSTAADLEVFLPPRGITLGRLESLSVGFPSDTNVIR
jgi:hypothetical protein